MKLKSITIYLITIFVLLLNTGCSKNYQYTEYRYKTIRYDDDRLIIDLYTDTSGDTKKGLLINPYIYVLQDLDNVCDNSKCKIKTYIDDDLYQEQKIDNNDFNSVKLDYFSLSKVKDKFSFEFSINDANETITIEKSSLENNFKDLKKEWGLTGTKIGRQINDEMYPNYSEYMNFDKTKVNLNINNYFNEEIPFEIIDSNGNIILEEVLPASTINNNLIYCGYSTYQINIETTKYTLKYTDPISKGKIEFGILNYENNTGGSSK